jgi:hypothetical protein
VPRCRGPGKGDAVEFLHFVFGQPVRAGPNLAHVLQEEKERTRKRKKAVRRQPLLGEPVIKLALKCYRRANLAKSRERRLGAGDGFFKCLNLEVRCCQIA